MRILARVGLLAALGLSSAGCSFLFVDGVPDRHEELLYFDCTSTPGLEVADGVFGLASGVNAGVFLSQSNAEFERENPGGDRTTAAAVNLAMAGVFAGSAIYGVIQTERCKDAKSEMRMRLIDRARRSASRPPAPPPRSVPAPPPVRVEPLPAPALPAPETTPSTPPTSSTPIQPAPSASPSGSSAAPASSASFGQ